MKGNQKKIYNIPAFQFLIFGIIVAIIPLLSNAGLISSSFVFAIGNTLIYAIVAIGFCLLLGYSGLASLGTAGFIGVGAYVTFYFMQGLGVPIIVAFIMTVIIAGIIGVIVGFISFLIEGIYLAILTLGLSEILRNLFISLKPTIKIDLDKVKLFGIQVGDTGIYYLILIVFVILLCITANLIDSPIGRALVSTKSSSVAAQAMGINIIKYRLLAFIISTIFAAIAGLLYMLYVRNLTTSSSTLLSMATSLNILGAVVLGGAKSLWGTTFGVFLIYGIQSMFLSKIQFFAENPAFITMVTGALIILIVMFFPGGIAQMVTMLKAKIAGAGKKKGGI